MKQKNKLATKASKLFYKAKGKTVKHAPEIFIIGGVIGMAVSTVMACKATTKAEEIIEDCAEQMDKIVTVRKKFNEDDYSKQDYTKDRVITSTKFIKGMVKVYSPAAAVCTVSVASILYGTKIFKKRNAALTAAYATLDSAFKGYRARVAERFGDDIEKEIRYGIKAATMEVVEKDEDGNETVVTKEVKILDPNALDETCRIYDDGCKGWTKDPEYNKSLLLSTQRFATKRLSEVGYLFLNEVYDMLGYPRTKAGQIIGWWYDEENPVGDNFVDFGLFDESSAATVDFVNGYERNVLLTFNHDGNILQYM